MRIFPEMWASTLCPFSNSTRNMAFGNGSVTVPSTRIVSSLGLAREHHLRGWGAPEARRTAGGRPARLPDQTRWSQAREDLGTTLRDRDGVLEVRGARAVGGDHRPAVVAEEGGRPARRHHRLDREDHALAQPQAP